MRTHELANFTPAASYQWMSLTWHHRLLYPARELRHGHLILSNFQLRLVYQARCASNTRFLQTFSSHSNVHNRTILRGNCLIGRFHLLFTVFRLEPVAIQTSIILVRHSEESDVYSASKISEFIDLDWHLRSRLF